jgi:hypothetical protein
MPEHWQGLLDSMEIRFELTKRGERVEVAVAYLYYLVERGRIGKKLFLAQVSLRLRTKEKGQPVGVLPYDKASWNKQHLPHRVPC